MPENQASEPVVTPRTKVSHLSSARKKSAFQETREETIPVISTKSFEVALTRDELPLTVFYEGATYVLVLTRNNKLLLQKPLN